MKNKNSIFFRLQNNDRIAHHKRNHLKTINGFSSIDYNVISHSKNVCSYQYKGVSFTLLHAPFNVLLFTFYLLLLIPSTLGQVCL